MMPSIIDEKLARQDVEASPPPTPASSQSQGGVWAAFPMPPTRLAPAWVQALVAVAYALVVVGIWAVFVAGWLNPMERATGGLVTRTLVANVVLLGIVLLIVLGLGHLKPGDVGLRWSQVGVGVAVTAGAWLLMQLAGLASGLVTGTLALAPTWGDVGVLAVLGALLGQLLGNALTEEVTWRGFALPQAYGRLAKRAWWHAHTGWTLIGALILSQGLFALIHLPNRLVSGFSGWELVLGLLVPCLLGVVFALVYLRTGNLFVAVGLHALVNAPTLLFAAGSVSAMVMLAVVALVLLIWPSLVMFGAQHASHSSQQQPVDRNAK